ncbi:MAG: flagellar biosynthesis anti-sigma factor FlgM [Oscillospiraceae bacterium]|nr:flagellar biosynthesis anti-sigma factor FlgM [Oscillospiraceae bacterium]
MNILKLNNASAAKIYAETNKKLNPDKPDKNEKQVKSGADVFEKDSVNISREAKNMNVLDFAKERIKADMNDWAKDLKDISSDKINRLKASVKTGDYSIDTDALVSAVINGVPQV